MVHSKWCECEYIISSDISGGRTISIPSLRRITLSFARTGLRCDETAAGAIMAAFETTGRACTVLSGTISCTGNLFCFRLSFFNAATRPYDTFVTQRIEGVLKKLTADNIYIVCDHTDMWKSIDRLLLAYSVA